MPLLALLLLFFVFISWQLTLVASCMMRLCSCLLLLSEWLCDCELIALMAWARYKKSSTLSCTGPPPSSINVRRKMNVCRYVSHVSIPPDYGTENADTVLLNLFVWTDIHRIEHQQSPHRFTLTEQHLGSILKIATKNITPDIDALINIVHTGIGSLLRSCKFVNLFY